MSTRLGMFLILGVASFAVFLAWQAGSRGSGPGIAQESPQRAAGDPPESRTDAGAAPDPVGTGEEHSGAGPDEGGQEPAQGTVIDSESGMRALIVALSERLEEPMLAWGQTRGLPREDPSGSYILDQPYQQYDNDTLQALATNGDMWAQQILADRIAVLRPAEAMELYRQAAASGSVYAMIQLAEVSARVARLAPDFQFEQEGVALEQYYSLRDSAVSPQVTAYAWNAVAEMAGLPGFMSFIGDSGMSDEQVGSACQLASGIYNDLLAQRDARGLGGYPNNPPPLWFDASHLKRGSACEHDRAVRYDLSACEAYEIRNPDSGEEVSLYVCEGS